MLTSGHDKMRISVVFLNFGYASQRSNGFEVLDVLPKGLMDLKFGHASQRFDGFVEGDICANVYGSFTQVPFFVRPSPFLVWKYKRATIDPMDFGRAKIDNLKVRELLSILQCIRELRLIL